MTLAQLLLLLYFLAFMGVHINVGQPISEADENAEKGHLDEIIQRAESFILRSLLKKIDDDREDSNTETSVSQLDWISKRQHPGKRSISELEKRQHPGKREEDDELAHYLELQKRQHPGRRSLWDPYLDISANQLAYLNEISKRQHPGKRYLSYSKRQHPGKRSWDDEIDGDGQALEKRQHPGKRYLDSDSPDYNVYNVPCDPQDSFNCSKANQLLEFLDNVSKGRIEEKRQHPGRRSSWDGEVEGEE